jgi:Predicted integral membrane protein
MVRSELKTKAKQAISGKIGAIFLVTFVVSLGFSIVFTIFNSLVSLIFGNVDPAAISATTTTGLIVSMVICWAVIILTVGGLALSFAAIFLNIGNKKPVVEDVKFGFKDGNLKRGIFGLIRYEIFVFFWSLLFVVPGIVKSYAYSQMFYLMADNKKLTASEAQKKSIEMMDGHKAEYFMLQLSFIPWVLLIVVTLGFGAIYVAPYIEATLAEFYKGLKKAAK